MIGYQGRPRDLIVVSVGLAIVALWFGANEIMSPANWVGFEPSFLAASSLAIPLVIFHGVLLLCIGLAFAAGWHVKTAALIFAAMLLEIIGTFALQGGPWDIAVRDFGLCCASLSVALRRN